MRFRLVMFMVLLGACQDGRDDGGVQEDVDASGRDASGGVDGQQDDAAATPDGQTGSTEVDPGPDAGDDGSPLDAPAPGGDGSVLDDTSGAPAGTRCESEDECQSGWCVPSAIGQVCVDPCVDVCDAGEQCIPAADSGTDPVYLCVPFVAPSPDATVGGDSESDVTDPDAATEGDAVASDATSDAGPIDDVVITDAGPEPDVPGGDTVVSDPDSDGDGIPDDEDNLPCLAVYLVVYNQDVTAASLTLNGVEIVSANAFPTTEPITVFINPTSGENTLALGGQLTGSPTDTLTLVVVDTDGHIWFATVIERNPGKPVDHSYSFDIDVTCP